MLGGDWRIGLTCAVGVWLAAAAAAAEPDLNVVSFNCLVEFAAKEGVPAWKDRRDLCAVVLADAAANLIGLQEPNQNQLAFFLDKLPHFRAVREARTTDAVLLYDQRVFDLETAGHWWLSPTPRKRSIGFGNLLPRLVVWGKFLHKPTGRRLYVFNTHFDNTSPSQGRMAKLCHQKLADFARDGLPMLFLGDFNTDQRRGDYRTLVSGGWRDSYTASEHASPNGADDNVPTLRGGTRIDHIFCHGALAPLQWRRLDSPVEGRPLSDHFPVQATFRFL